MLKVFMFREAGVGFLPELLSGVESRLTKFCVGPKAPRKLFDAGDFASRVTGETGIVLSMQNIRTGGVDVGVTTPYPKGSAAGGNDPNRAKKGILMTSIDTSGSEPGTMDGSQ
jgi:hypothetical protein